MMYFSVISQLIIKCNIKKSEVLGFRQILRILINMFLIFYTLNYLFYIGIKNYQRNAPLLTLSNYKP